MANSWRVGRVSRGDCGSRTFCPTSTNGIRASHSGDNETILIRLSVQKSLVDHLRLDQQTRMLFIFATKKTALPIIARPVPIAKSGK
jgi:hypothetical protein